MREEIHAEALDLIFNLVKGAPEKQLHDLETLDAKMVQIFGAASIVIPIVAYGAERIINDNHR